MKKKNQNGQVLSEKEMRGVKGGAWIVVANPPQDWRCDVCGATLTDFHHEEGSGYVSVCKVCGCITKQTVKE